MQTGYDKSEQLNLDLEERQDIRQNWRYFPWKLRMSMRIGKAIQKLYQNVRLRMSLLIVLAFAWWGILYPELCFTEDTVQQVIVADGETRTVRENDYKEIMNAAGDEIVIGSRLLEWLEERNWFRRGG